MAREPPHQRGWISTAWPQAPARPAHGALRSDRCADPVALAPFAGARVDFTLTEALDGAPVAPDVPGFERADVLAERSGCGDAHAWSSRRKRRA
jgi:hypothetical protein